MAIKHVSIAALAVALTMGEAVAGNPDDGFNWMLENREVLREGIIWNDRIGDGKDRYKSGGITQGWLIPESRFAASRWFEGRASGLEIQARGYVMTPDNVAQGGSPTDRPYAQFFGIGAYLRTVGEPVSEGRATTRSTEDRIGIEFGFQGDPLPLFEIQELIHNNGGFVLNPTRTLDSEVLINLEARRTWRWHLQLNDTDFEFAPYMMASAGMRENSVRLGGDFIYGSSLEGRTWNIDPAIGALIPGGAMPRSGANWMMWLGGDAGAVATDAFLDGGFNQNGFAVPKEEFVARVRVGFMMEYDDIALAYSLTWLSEEFETQKHSQVIGAISLKYRF